MKCFVAGVVVVFAIAASAFGAASADRGAALYIEKCEVCHSVGGGDLAGPDLLRSMQQPVENVRAAVHRMEDNVGTLTVDEVESLVALLKNPRIREIIAAAKNPPAVKAEEVPRGSATAGRRLFFGEMPFANGGTPCFACHVAGGRGGTLAADLTLVHQRLNRTALVTAAARPPFPMMKAAYAKHAITQQEALDLAAFLEAPAVAARERTGVVHGTAAGAAVLVLAGLGFVLRIRRAGVRSRLVSGGE